MTRMLKFLCLVATVGASMVACSSASPSQAPQGPDDEGEAEAAAVVAEECKPVTYIEIVHRVNGANVTDRLRLTDEAASSAALALRSFQVAANHFGAANIVASRPITQVQCFAPQPVGRRPPGAIKALNSTVCVTWDDVPQCTEVTPSHTYDYSGTESCTVTDHHNHTTIGCEDSSVIVTRNGDVVLTINTQTLRNGIASRTQALRRLVGDANIVTNFHFDVVITPEQQASIVGNQAFNNIAATLRQAANAGQPLPNVQQILSELPDPPANIDFYNQLIQVEHTKLERLNLLAQILNGKLLSPGQVNAFIRRFVGDSKLVDKLDVQHTPSSLNQATGIINNTINQLATTDPSSTIYEQVKSGAQSVLDTHTSGGVFDPDKTVDFVVPNLHQFLTDADLDKRLIASEVLIKFNEQLRQGGARQRAHDMAGVMKMMVPALQHDDMDKAWRLWDQVQATEFFFDHTDPTGTSFDIHLTPQAEAMFNIAVQPTSARAYEVITLLNEVASYDDQTGRVTIDFKAIITLNARSALTAQDVHRSIYLTEESWGVLSFLKNAGGVAAAAAAAALAELGIEAIGIIDLVGIIGWGGAEAIFNHLTGAVANWHLTMEKILELGGELIHGWPGMTAAEKAELVARLAGDILETLPPDALGADRLEEAIERAIRAHLDRAARGLEIVQRGHVALREEAAVELVKHLESYGIESIDEALQIADALDDVVPCDIVAPMGGAIVATRWAITVSSIDEPPCGEQMIRALFESFKATSRERGFTIPEDLKDLVTSVEKSFPPRIVSNALNPTELSFAERVLEHEGRGTLVGARGTGKRAVDGFLNGFGMQLKAPTTLDVVNMLEHVGHAWKNAKGIKDLDLFIRCEQFTRQQVLEMIPQRFVIEHYLLDGRIGKAHFLTSDGWIDIVRGVIQ